MQPEADDQHPREADADDRREAQEHDAEGVAGSAESAAEDEGGGEADLDSAGDSEASGGEVDDVGVARREPHRAVPAEGDHQQAAEDHD